MPFDSNGDEKNSLEVVYLLQRSAVEGSLFTLRVVSSSLSSSPPARQTLIIFFIRDDLNQAFERAKL